MVVGVIVLSARAVAHDTWLLPDSTDVEPGAAVRVQLTSGMAFPANESAVAPDRLMLASYRLNGEVAPLSPGAPGKEALSLRFVPRASGIVAIWIATKPRTLELTPAQVREYLDEIGAWETVGREWERAGSGRWRESYAKIAKSYVRVGTSADGSWSQPVGTDFELVPQADPTDLRQGKEISVRLLKKGRPAPRMPVGYVVAGRPKGGLATSDAEGLVRVSLDRPGPWLLRATSIERSARATEDWESRFTTLTLMVRPSRPE